MKKIEIHITGGYCHRHLHLTSHKVGILGDTVRIPTINMQSYGKLADFIMENYQLYCIED